MKIWPLFLGVLLGVSSQQSQGMTVGTQVFFVNDSPITQKQSQHFQNLSSQQQNQFKERHFAILNKAATLLTYGKLTLGAGSLVGSKISEFYHSNDIPNPIFNFTQEASEEATVKPTMGQRGHNAIQFIISSIDAFLWNHIEIISHAKEFGVSGMIGVEAGLKAADRGICPACALGISLAYNAESKILTFDLFTDVEFVDKAYPFIAQASFFGRFMGFVSSQESNTKIQPLKMRVISPMGFMATMDAPTHLGIGVEGGVGFPPFDSFASYKSELTRRSIMKKGMGFSSLKPLCGSLLKWLKPRKVPGTYGSKSP